MTHTPTSSGVSAEARRAFEQCAKVADRWETAANGISDAEKNHFRKQASSAQAFTAAGIASDIRALASPLPTPPRPSSDTIGGGEPAGYLFELCYSHANDRWSGTMFSEHLPYPESDIRNVRPLYFAASPHVEEEPLAAVAVKAIEWVRRPIFGGEDRIMSYDGYYWLSRVSTGFMVIAEDGIGHVQRLSGDVYPTEESAKSAAQQDFEARILAALVPLPKPAIEARLRKALQLCVDMIVANGLETALANTLETARTALSLQGGDKL